MEPARECLAGSFRRAIDGSEQISIHFLHYDDVGGNQADGHAATFVRTPAGTCTAEGLRAAQASVRNGLRINMTLCFSQQQAAAVYGATKGTQTPVYVSPFIGRLDDIGLNGIDLIRNVKRMFAKGDGHVLVLAASIRSLDHLLSCFALGTDLVTVPAKILTLWAEANFPLPGDGFAHKSLGRPIPFEDLNLERPWESFDISHELTTRGIEKFVGDYRRTLASD